MSKKASSLTGEKVLTAYGGHTDIFNGRFGLYILQWSPSWHYLSSVIFLFLFPTLGSAMLTPYC
ncbi:unnamed protein product, partial [Nesidiocoris tenuis]